MKAEQKADRSDQIRPLSDAAAAAIHASPILDSFLGGVIQKSGGKKAAHFEGGRIVDAKLVQMVELTIAQGGSGRIYSAYIPADSGAEFRVSHTPQSTYARDEAQHRHAEAAGSFPRAVSSERPELAQEHTGRMTADECITEGGAGCKGIASGGDLNARASETEPTSLVPQCPASPGQMLTNRALKRKSSEAGLHYVTFKDSLATFERKRGRHASPSTGRHASPSTKESSGDGTFSKTSSSVLKEAPIFRPTLAEFQDAVRYIESIREQAEPYGIVKIVPPDGWTPPFSIDVNSGVRFRTWLQELHTFQESAIFGDGAEYTASEYKKAAQKFMEAWLQDRHGGEQDVTLKHLEDDYWSIINGHEDVAVEYAKDLNNNEGMQEWSGFPKPRNGATGATSSLDLTADASSFSPSFYRRSGWNLKVMPKASRCLLRHVVDSISGVTQPWLYFGSLFTTFCWHNEDHHYGSINYNHKGAPKQWYGIPSEHLQQFHDAMVQSCRSPGELLNMTYQCDPKVIAKRGIPVHRLEQHEGEFVITFPGALHMGFNYGWNCTEAVNFATIDWLVHGAAASNSYRAYNLRVNGTDQPKRPSLLGFERLLFTLAANWSCYTPRDRSMVHRFLEPIVQKELCDRQGLAVGGVKRFVEAANRDRNSPTRISKETRDFDEMRECCLCKHPCFLSVVICECSSDRVACLEHWSQACRCSAEKKTMVEYETAESMQQALLCLVSQSDSDVVGAIIVD